MSNIEEYTKNFKFMIPEFNVATWHTEIKENFKAIDALIANFVQSQQYQGAWKQVTSYIINDLVYISDEDSDYYGYLMRVKVNHTTTGDDFDTFLANNPTYYEVQGEMGAQLAALRAQDWAEKTDGKVVINEVPIDYSAKAYAIGGTGTETNNAKYFKEQAELARDTILEDPGFIAIKADFLGDETIKTVAENIGYVQNVSTDIQSVIDVATNIANVNTLASYIAAVLTNSENISSINTNASNISDINNVSSNMSDINNCSDNMAAILDAPTQAANAADSATAAAISAAGTHFKLFHHDWFDYQLNDLAWLRADTFSWQNGTVYSDAYNHLVADYNGGTSQTETVGSYTISYKLAADGHKITTDETTVQNIYNATGVAWYYILDTTNQRFKLPRENPDKEKIISLTQAPVVGNGKGLGLTNSQNTGMMIWGTPTIRHLGVSKSSTAQNVGTVNSNTFDDNYNNYVTGVSTSESLSGLVAKLNSSTSSSYYKGKQYLYFYVGQFSQTAVEQTAGLNSSLFNGKMDLDMSNIDNTNNAASTALNTAGIRTIIETYVNGTDWYRIYSDGWCEQGGRKQHTSSDTTQTVNLLVAFANTNYTVLRTTDYNGTLADSHPSYVQGVYSLSTDKFVIGTEGRSSWVAVWYACGYIR